MHYYSIAARNLIYRGSVYIEVEGPYNNRNILRYSGAIFCGSGNNKACIVWSDPIYPSEEAARSAMEAVIKKVRGE